jgi:hypothetical protein
LHLPALLQQCLQLFRLQLVRQLTHAQRTQLSINLLLSAWRITKQRITGFKSDQP